MTETNSIKGFGSCNSIQTQRSNKSPGNSPRSVLLDSVKSNQPSSKPASLYSGQSPSTHYLLDDSQTSPTSKTASPSSDGSDDDLEFGQYPDELLDQYEVTINDITDHFGEGDFPVEEVGSRFTVCNIPEDDRDLYYPVDSVQQTVTSFGGISVDTQDSANYEGAPFQCGNIQFLGETTEAELEPKRHYVVIPSDTPTEEIPTFMCKYWQMRSPKIIVPIISAVKHFKTWKNSKLREQFQKGIIKAANKTEMWIITNGVDGGISKMVGEAIREEKAARATARVHLNKINPSHIEKFKKFVLIGIVPKSGITYGSRFDGSERVTVQNIGNRPSDLYELNPDHTHFFVVDEEDTERMFFTNTRCALEKQLEQQIGRPRRIKRMFSIGSDDEHPYGSMDFVSNKTLPVVALLVQGSPRGIDHVLFYLRNKMPVVVLKGSGGIADLICYAYEEIQERTDPDFIENLLKAQLTKMIGQTYQSDFKDNDLARNAFRDKILECVELCHDEDQTFLTILNAQGDANLIDLDKYLLKAIFSAEKQSRSRWREQMSKNLQLTLDWNRPDLALSEIFRKDDWTKIRVEKDLFEKALLRKDREKFVEMFLDHGIQVHKYLNHKKLKLLFERAEDREFFQTICLEGALGKDVDPDAPLDQNFCTTDLNRLIYKLTLIKDIIQPYELSMNSFGLYVLDPAVAERKALNCLIIWAVLMNRHKLAKVLWNRCDEPICVALICSNMYRQMAKFSMELYLRTEMENNAKDFGEMALGVLDISYKESSVHAYSMLGKSLPDFNNKSTIQIAHESNYMNFIAHPCCQKWLTKRLFGAIQVKELDSGIFRIPYWMKIIASAMLIFPMYIWITFTPSARRKSKGITIKESLVLEDDVEEDSSDDDDDDEVNVPASKSMLEIELNRIKKKRKLSMKLKSAFKKKEFKLPIWRRIYLLWTAPITKFWLTQVFYFIYLGVFCLALLWPTCGNLSMDLVVWFWTAMILTELVRNTYIKHQVGIANELMKKYRAWSLLKNFTEIVLILIFLILTMFLRIVPYGVQYSNIHVAKTVMCVGLLYFFYRLLGLYLPISPTLGPMYVRMIRMIKHDFIAFIRMFLIFMISGGVTIQAILYPNYPLGVDMIKRVLTRPLFAMFLTQIYDLEGDPACSPMYSNVTVGFCAAEYSSTGFGMNTAPEIEPLKKCPYSSIAGYLIVIQYLLICKLVMVTLLFAMFALTITKVDNIAGLIWKFQRYALIVEFEDRPSFPPPLTILFYLYMLVKFIFNRIKGCRKKCASFCTCLKKKKAIDSDRMVHRVQKIKRSENYNYWKKCAKEYVTTQEVEMKKQTEPQRQAEVISCIQEDLKVQKKNWKRMNDKITELERMMQSSRLYLEDISHKLENPDVLGIANVKGQIIHVVARQSPYPGTRFTRFPVFDKYVPWEQPYDVYDPRTYTRPKEQFPEDEICFVDEDMIELLKLQEERDMLPDDEKEELPALPTFTPVWNAVVAYKVDEMSREVDRRSWMSHKDQPLRYKLDPIGLPKNPKGRTGLRGKGVLWRWGPNHVIKAVCTRWRRKYNTDYQPTGFLYVEGKRVLEFIAVRKYGVDDIETVYGLPGDALHGLTTPYSTLCRSFMRSVMDDQEFETKIEYDQADMIQFFAQFSCQVFGTRPLSALGTTSRSNSQSQIIPQFLPVSRTSSRTSLRTETDSQGFSAALIYKGYVDDPRNTDNAWVEAEVWNFHYDTGDMFDMKLPEDNSVNWKECSPNVKIFGNEGAIVQEAARIHDAYH